MVGMSAPGRPLKVNFAIFNFVSSWVFFPVRIHFKGNLKVDTEVDIQKGEVPTVSKGRNRGMVHRGQVLTV